MVLASSVLKLKVNGLIGLQWRDSLGFTIVA